MLNTSLIKLLLRLILAWIILGMWCFSMQSPLISLEVRVWWWVLRKVLWPPWLCRPDQKIIDLSWCNHRIRGHSTLSKFPGFWSRRPEVGLSKLTISPFYIALKPRTASHESINPLLRSVPQDCFPRNVPRSNIPIKHQKINSFTWPGGTS